MGTDIIINVKCTKNYIISNKYLSWFDCIIKQVRMSLPREGRSSRSLCPPRDLGLGLAGFYPQPVSKGDQPFQATRERKEVTGSLAPGPMSSLFSKMVQNGPKLSEMVQNDIKCSILTQSWRQCTKGSLTLAPCQLLGGRRVWGEM